MNVSTKKGPNTLICRRHIGINRKAASFPVQVVSALVLHNVQCSTYITIISPSNIWVSACWLSYWKFNGLCSVCTFLKGMVGIGIVQY